MTDLFQRALAMWVVVDPLGTLPKRTLGQLILGRKSPEKHTVLDA